MKRKFLILVALAASWVLASGGVCTLAEPIHLPSAGKPTAFLAEAAENQAGQKPPTGPTAAAPATAEQSAPEGEKVATPASSEKVGPEARAEKLPQAAPPEKPAEKVPDPSPAEKPIPVKEGSEASPAEKPGSAGEIPKDTPPPAEESKPVEPSKDEKNGGEQPKDAEEKAPKIKVIQEKQEIPVPGRMEKLVPGKPAAEPPKPKLPPLPPWQPPRAEQVRAKVFSWLDARQVPPEHRARIDQLWAVDMNQLSGLDLLVRVVLSYALGDVQAAELVKLCSYPRTHLILPSFPWLQDPKTDPYLAANLRLLYGRWLVHEMLYEEALEILGNLNPDDVADPATLLFYQSVANYFLLHQEEGLRRLEALLREPDHCPRRYVALATLMQEDLKNLREETLDHIARRMKDVERRLGLYRAGPKVRYIQDKIVEDLDKIIKRLEEQQQQQNNSGGSSGSRSSRSIRSSRPAQDSQIIGGKGPGEVEKRDVGSGSGWGNLPPKEREEVLQQIGRDFPAQYRDKIEQYFRKLAESSEIKKSP